MSCGDILPQGFSLSRRWSYLVLQIGAGRKGAYRSKVCRTGWGAICLRGNPPRGIFCVVCAASLVLSRSLSPNRFPHNSNPPMVPVPSTRPCIRWTSSIILHSTLLESTPTHSSPSPYHTANVRGTLSDRFCYTPIVLCLGSHLRAATMQAQRIIQNTPLNDLSLTLGSPDSLLMGLWFDVFCPPT
jgi:hypothetical protein